MTTASIRSTRSTAREPFDRGAWLLLAFVAVLMALCAAQLVYRYTVLTDGWASENADEVCELTLRQNVEGAASGLQPGDVVTAINGKPFDPACWTADRPEGWQAGGSVVYTVRRGEQVLEVRVPVTHWTLAGVVGNNFGSVAALAGGFGATLLFFALGLYTLLNRPATPAARAMFLFSSVFFINSLSNVIPADIGVRFDPAALYPVSFFSYAIIGTFFGPTLFCFSLVFPRPKAIVARHPWLALLPFSASIVVLLAVYVFNAGAVGFDVTMLLLFGTIVSLAHSALTMRDAVSRAQLRWGIGGVVLGLAIALLTFLPSLPGFETLNRQLAVFFANTFTLGFLLMGVSLSVAILRYRIFDIDVVIRRTLTYSVLTVLLATVYFGGVVLLEGVFRDTSGGTSSFAIVLSTLAIAALFAPLRRRVQAAIDRRFNRRAYDAARTLAAFGGKLRDEVELQVLTDQLIEVVDETMQPAHLRLWLRD